MRIIIWTDGFWPEIGGLELFCMRIVTALKQGGHTCAVITERKESTGARLGSYRGIPVYRFCFERAFRRGDLALLRREHESCSQIIDEFNPDVIHLNAVMRGTFGFLLQQRRRRLPTVLTLHDDSIAKYARETGPILLKTVDIIAAISQSNRAFLVNFDPRVKDKIRVILNALPPPEISPAPLPASFRLLAIGRLVKEKGFDLAIRAFGEVAGDFPEATLTVAGDGKEFGALRQLARETNAGSRIHFPGWIDAENVPELINQHSLVIMPSRWQEPFGLVALQTAQMARPIIAARSGALPEIVVDGVTGFLVENENLAGYVEALRRFLEDPPLLGRIGLQARQHVEACFPFSHFIADYEDAYLAARQAQAIPLNSTR